MRRLLAALLLVGSCFAQERRVAVTIDDLPVGQAGRNGCQMPGARIMTERILGHLRAHKAPVTAFVIGNNCASLPVEQRRELLEMWRAAGAALGNHSWSHPDFNTMPVAEYEQNILRGDAWLRETLGLDRVQWFRSPFLHTGADAASKQRLVEFLREHHWRQAAVTFDNSDWMFSNVFREGGEAAERARREYVPYLESVIAFFEKRSVEVVGREFPQVLLLHANVLNAEMLGEVLSMLERRGYRFITLDAAMQDSAYSLPDEYAGKGGFSWIHRWSMTKKMPGKGEPDEPKWLQEAFQKLQ